MTNVGVCTTLWTIHHGAFNQNSQRLHAVNYFRKKFCDRCLAGFYISNNPLIYLRWIYCICFVKKNTIACGKIFHLVSDSNKKVPFFNYQGRIIEVEEHISKSIQKHTWFGSFADASAKSNCSMWFIEF